MNIAIVGGGATGLSAAWHLSRAGHAVKLLEASSRLGGSVRSDSTGGWMIEAGPNSIQESTQALVDLIADLGLSAERLEASSTSKNRFIVLNGKLAALPGSLGQFLSTPTMTGATKWRIVTEFMRSYPRRQGDVSVAQFVRDHFGPQLVERILQPFISGIYAGDPEKLCVRHAFPTLWEAEQAKGSIVRGMAAGSKQRRASGKLRHAKLISFRRGLQALTDALAAGLPAGSVEVGAAVGGLGPGERSRWSVQWAREGQDFKGEFDAVVLAVPASSLAELQVGSLGARPLAGLAAVEQPPVTSFFLGYRRDQISHPLDGFGVLVPSVEKRSVLGVLFNSSLFEGRAPAGHVALTVMVGGILQPDIARMPEDALLARIQADLADLLGAQGQPVFSRRTFWPRAIPQYNLGYDVHLGAIADCERAHPGLYVAGNVRDGIALSDCLKSGASVAKRVS